MRFLCNPKDVTAQVDVTVRLPVSEPINIAVARADVKTYTRATISVSPLYTFKFNIKLFFLLHFLWF